MQKIPLETLGEESAVRFRDALSVRYIQSAALLCRLGFAIEQEFREAGRAPPDAILRHEAFILNAVLSSVSFLESTVNEFHADAVDGAWEAGGREVELFRRIGEGWKNRKNFDRAPVLTRYQKILGLAGLGPFDEDDRAFENVRELIGIRNNLLHYRREWVAVRTGSPRREGGETASERLEQMLRKKFALNPFAAINVPFFPDKCLGHGCAEWAVLNCVIFTDEFFRRLGLPAPYEGVRGELITR